KDGGIKGVARSFGLAILELYLAGTKQFLRRGRSHALADARKVAIVFPEGKFASSVGTEKCLGFVLYSTAAERAFADRIGFFRHHNLGITDYFIVLNQTGNHIFDLVHKVLAGIFAFLNEQQFFFPIRRHGWGLNL